MAQGHRTVPHTADLCIQAWGPTREACLAEAVRGLVGSFAAVTAARPHRTATRHLTAGSDEDLLVAVIDEVIYWLDAQNEIPVTVTVQGAGDGGVDLTLSFAEAGAVEIIGAAPKAASLHDLRCAPDEAGQWSCSVIVDV
jgi:SHS2 domain-containing protein